jgi:hypothetical protein
MVQATPRCAALCRLAWLVLLVALPSPTHAGEPADPWAPYRFLLGSWAGTGSGKPGEAIAGATSFALELGGQVMVRRNRAEYAPRESGGNNVVHEDLLVIYREPGESAPRAIYFDNEGHTIHYTVTIPEKQPGVVLESAAGAPGPRFRLSYEARPDGAPSVDFAIGAPGQPFKSYATGLLRKGA